MSSDDGLEGALLARVVACNFDNSVFDTNDLSTIRGGSLILLHFPEQVEQRLQKERPDLQVAAIATGASELLFRFAPSPGGTKAVEELLQTMLCDSAPRAEEPWSLFTYVWALETPEDRNGRGFLQRLTRLVARCNTRQFQQPTIITPPFYSDKTRKDAGKKSDTASVVCGLDGVRPTEPGVVRKGKPVSHSVRCRRDFGAQAKQKFYDQELTGLPPLELCFASDFSELAPTSDEQRTYGIPEALTGKMALIYLDGNSFGKKRGELGKTAKDLKIFSEEVKAKRKNLLHKVLTDLAKLPGMTFQKDGETFPRLRFETLLWGGDEVMWALPAWRAWAVMGVIQAHLNDRDRWGELTHAAGMLIAPYKAPIKDLTTLVKDLGETAKQGEGRLMNGVQIGVVTGFDLPGLDADALRRPLFDLDGKVGDVPHGVFRCDGAEWGAIKDAMATIKDPKGGLPRSTLHRIHYEAMAKGLFATGQAERARAHLDDHVEQIGRIHEGAVNHEALDTLRKGFPGAEGADDHPLIPLHQILSLWNIAQ